VTVGLLKVVRQDSTDPLGGFGIQHALVKGADCVEKELECQPCKFQVAGSDVAAVAGVEIVPLWAPQSGESVLVWILLVAA